MVTSFSLTNIDVMAGDSPSTTLPKTLLAIRSAALHLSYVINVYMSIEEYYQSFLCPASLYRYSTLSIKGTEM